MAPRALRPPSILLVSNSVDEREAYPRSLRASGYRVVNAATTVLAYQIATTRRTDIVVTDGHCAGSMSGLELTRRLRIHTRTTTVPIIVLTSVTRRHDGDLPIRAVRLRPRQFGSQGDVGVSVGGNTRPADHRTCPQCHEVLEYRHKSPVPLGDGTERSAAPRAFALRVWLVLQQRGVRVSRVGRVTGIAVG